MNILPGIICSAAAALSRSPAALPAATRPAGHAVVVTIERAADYEEERANLPAAENDMRRAAPSARPQTTPARIGGMQTDSQGVTGSNGTVNNGSNASGITNGMNNNTVNNGTPIGKTEKTGNTAQNNTGTQNRTGNLSGGIQNGTAANDTTLRNGTADNNTGAQNKMNAGNTDMQNGTNPKGTTGQNDTARPQIRSMIGTLNTTETADPQTPQTADERYNRLKAQLDTQFDYMFRLKDDIDNLSSVQQEKWEEYHSLHQAYQRKLKRIIADWVTGQTLMA